MSANATDGRMRCVPTNGKPTLKRHSGCHGTTALWHTIERKMPRTWQHFPKYLAAHLLDRYSIDIRLFFDKKSNNNRRTIEQQSKNNRTTNEEQTKNSACNPVSNTCQVPVNNEPTVWLRRANIEAIKNAKNKTNNQKSSRSITRKIRS